MKKYQCKVYDEELNDFLDNKPNVSEFIRNVLNDFRTGKLSYESPENIDLKIKKLKIADLTLKVWSKFKDEGYSLDQLDNFVNNGILNTIPENRTIEAPIIQTNSNQQLEFGKTITYKSDKILQQDGTLRCKHCNKKIGMRAFDFEQLDDYKKHVESIHGELENVERAELLEIYPN